jgi:hypothetical protein
MNTDNPLELPSWVGISLRAFNRCQTLFAHLRPRGSRQTLDAVYFYDRFKNVFAIVFIHHIVFCRISSVVLSCLGLEFHNIILQCLTDN